MFSYVIIECEMTFGHELHATEYFGRRIAQRQLSDIYVTDNVYPPGATLAPHSHTNAFVALCLAGGYTETAAGATYDGSPGTAVFHLPRQVHSNRVGAKGARVISIELTPRWLERLSIAKFAQWTIDAPALPKLVAELNNNDAASSLAIEACVLQIVAKFARDTPQPRRWIARVERIVREHFAQPLSLRELAAEAGVHPVHLVREFRKTTGKTVGEMIRELRVQQATLDLLHTSRSIAEIASRAGFADQSHMARWIKRYTGMSPSRLRRSAHPATFIPF